MLKFKPVSKPHPCMLTALELIGIDDPAMPDGRARDALGIVKRLLGNAELASDYDSHLSVVARRVLFLAPVKDGGLLPFKAIFDIIKLQGALVPYGVLVRGAITLGDAAAREEIFFGQGIGEAESLRDQVAHVPRVIVDPRLLREVEQNANLRAQQHTAMQELGYLRELLRADADGLLSVDYLLAFQWSVDEPSRYIAFLEQHRRLVMQKLEASTALDRTSRAWTWLWSYHNLVIDELKAKWSGDPQDLADLRIPATGPLLYTFPPSAKAP